MTKLQKIILAILAYNRTHHTCRM